MPREELLQLLVLIVAVSWSIAVLAASAALLLSYWREER